MKKINGGLVSSSHRGLSIVVEPKDIANGDEQEPNTCAIAQACVRQIPGVKEAYVYRNCTYLKIKGEWMRFKTSPAARLETIVFDRGGRFQPGAYDLLPVPVAELVARKTRRRSASSPSPKRRGTRPRHILKDVRPAAVGNIGEKPREPKKG